MKCFSEWMAQEILKGSGDKKIKYCPEKKSILEKKS